LALCLFVSLSLCLFVSLSLCLFNLPRSSLSRQFSVSLSFFLLDSDYLLSLCFSTSYYFCFSLSFYLTAYYCFCVSFFLPLVISVSLSFCLFASNYLWFSVFLPIWILFYFLCLSLCEYSQYFHKTIKKLLVNKLDNLSIVIIFNLVWNICLCEYHEGRVFAINRNISRGLN